MTTDLITLAQGAALNLVVAFVIVRFIYARDSQEKRFVFSFLALNTVIYFVLGLLTRVNLSIGVGFGLFAIFSVLRYRTEETPIREMTYLFVLLALPVMNAVIMPTGALPQLLLANGVVVVVLFILEHGWGFRYEARSQIVYERIELIQPGRYAELLDDLRARTGLPVTRATVGRIDFLRDSAEITLFYDPRAHAAQLARRAEADGPRSSRQYEPARER